jgi:hypothetical protein
LQATLTDLPIQVEHLDGSATRAHIYSSASQVKIILRPLAVQFHLTRRGVQGLGHQCSRDEDSVTRFVDMSTCAAPDVLTRGGKYLYPSLLQHRQRSLIDRLNLCPGEGPVLSAWETTRYLIQFASTRSRPPARAGTLGLLFMGNQPPHYLSRSADLLATGANIPVDKY